MFVLQARFIAFNPVDVYGRQALKLELYGCQLPNEQDTNYPAVNTDIEVCFERSLLSISMFFGNVFGFCSSFDKTQASKIMNQYV